MIYIYQNRPELFPKTRLSTLNDSAQNVVGFSFTRVKQGGTLPRGRAKLQPFLALTAIACGYQRWHLKVGGLVDKSTWNGSIFMHFRGDSWIWCSFYHLVVESWRTHIFMASPAPPRKPLIFFTQLLPCCQPTLPLPHIPPALWIAETASLGKWYLYQRPIMNPSKLVCVGSTWMVVVVFVVVVNGKSEVNIYQSHGCDENQTMMKPPLTTLCHKLYNLCNIV